MGVYLLFYDTDTGAREEWNTFYTPVEVFPTKETRQLRESWLRKKYSKLTFYRLDCEYETYAGIERPLEHLEQDDEEDSED